MKAISDELVKIITQKTPGLKPAVFLAELLSTSKEAAYRRLRGEVPFTLDEAAVICRRLNISLDLLAGIKQENNFAFHMDTFLTNNPLREYCDMLERITQSVVPLRKDPRTVCYRANKTMPQEFMYNYEMLSKVYVYILYYQRYSNKIELKTLSELELPENMFRLQKNSTSCIHDFNSVIILDKRIISDYIEIVNYFFFLELITRDEVLRIKGELLEMINDMEQCAEKGTSFSNKKMDIYLSHITFDCNYCCIESSSFSVASTGIYCVDYLSSENTIIFDLHKTWIKSLLKFTSLISQIDELTRKNFFREQRKYVETMFKV